MIPGVVLAQKCKKTIRMESWAACFQLAHHVFEKMNKLSLGVVLKIYWLLNGASGSARCSTIIFFKEVFLLLFTCIHYLHIEDNVNSGLGVIKLCLFSCIDC